MSELLLKEEVFKIIAAAIEVHREFGSGFAEAVYQEAFELELLSRQLPFERQKAIPIRYKGQLLNCSYITDIICFNSIVVELKVMNKLSGKEESQLLNYLKATGLRVGVLINIGAHGKLEWHRYVR